jgi:predicted GTPase
MLTLKQGIKISAIIDKLELKISIPKEDTSKKDTSKKDSTKNGLEMRQQEVGFDLMVQVVSKAHKAEKEIYAFVAEIKKCTLEEAEDVDLMEFIKDIFSDSSVVDFFKSAVKSKAQE